MISHKNSGGSGGGNICGHGSSAGVSLVWPMIAVDLHSGDGEEIPGV